MKSLVSTLIAIGAIIPAGTAYAEIVIHNSGSVSSYTSASASTGGQRASSGQSITTGDASASAHSETRVDGAGGSVNVKVETSENGVVQTKEYSQPLESGKGVKVEVNASSKNGVSTSTIRVNNTEVESHVGTSSGATSWGIFKASPQGSRLHVLFSTTLPDIFKHIFGFFWRF